MRTAFILSLIHLPDVISVVNHMDQYQIQTQLLFVFEEVLFWTLQVLFQMYYFRSTMSRSTILDIASMQECKYTSMQELQITKNIQNS